MAATLPRELLRWIQSLDLTWSVKNPKWDVSNGYLVAEIFSWYYPQDVEMCMFQNGSSLKLKLANWQLIKQFMKRRKIPIPEAYADAVMHCKEGAAVLFLQAMYELLTNRQLKVIPADPEIDFTDHAYQAQLPEHARSTAVHAIRNNLKSTELRVNSNITTKRTLSQAIINRHAEDRAIERQRNPARFDHRPTVGELAIRRPPPADYRSYDGSLNGTPDSSAGGEDEGWQNDETAGYVDQNEDGQLSRKQSAVRFSSTDPHQMNADS